MRSEATTVAEYLDELPEERSAIIATLRDFVLEHLPEGYEESMNWGMISYEIPLSAYPKTYNGQPLGYIALAAQKRHYGLYMMGVYGRPEEEAKLRNAYDAAGKKLDMGKSCIRFKKLDDLEWSVLGELISGTSPDAYIAHYEAARGITSG